MCVIFYQTKKDALFSHEDFKNAAKTNPHGMGWMANVDGIIKYKKGYFDVDEFYKDYLALRKEKGLVDISLHFRIGTGSAIDVANCHPFPISSVPKRIKSAKGHCDIGVMMNGIIGASTKEFSDTALYVMNNLKNYYNHDRRFYLHFNKRTEMLFENEIHGCRFVLMSKEGTKLFGIGWSDYEGKAMVSNRHWIPRKITYTPTTYNNRDFSYYYADDDYYGRVYDSYDSWYLKRNAKRFSKKNGEKHKSYIDKLIEEVV